MNEPYNLPEGLSWADNYRRVILEFDLKRIADGEIRRCRDEGYPFLPTLSPAHRVVINSLERTKEELISGIIYWHTQGNGGCGCNRSIFFAEAGGEPRPEEPQCGNQFELVWPGWLAEED